MPIHPVKVTLFVLIPSLSWATIARVQTASNNDTLVTVLTVTPVSAPADGDVQVMEIYTNNSATGGVSSIIQAGALWQQAVDVDNTIVEAEIWYSTGTTSASNSITINLSGTLSVEGTYGEYSGFSSSFALDKIATATDLGNPPTSGTTATTTSANELWISALASQAKGNALTAPTNGFSLVLTGAGPTMQYGYLENIVSTTGTASTAVTQTVTGTTHVAGCMATFSGAAAAPTITGDPTLLLMNGAD